MPFNPEVERKINNSRKITCVIVITYTFLLFLLLCYVTQSGFFNNTEPVEYNNSKFNVLSNMPNKQEAAKILHDVDSMIVKLKSHIDSKFSNDYIISEEAKYKGKGNILKKIKNRLTNTYKQSSLKENYPRTKKVDVSYNLNKGSTIALCLRDYDESENFHDFNEILFVSIHELAHSLNCDESSIMCGNSYGHDNMFWYIFRILLENAVECGIYKKKDYRNNPVDYCSMEITYSPLFDKSLDDLAMYNSNWS